MHTSSSLLGLLAFGLSFGAVCQTPSSLEVTTSAAAISPAASGCTGTPTVACLGPGGRFLVEGTYALEDGRSGPLRLQAYTEASGLFTYDDSADLQGVVKVLDVCGVTGSFWVFLGALTDQEVHLRVTDTYTGSVRRYDNPLKSPLLPIYDFTSFTGCAAAPCTYTLGAAGATAPSGGLNGSVSVTAASACVWNAASNAAWIHLDQSTSVGSGSGPVRFTVDSNPGAARAGTLTIAGQTFTVTQAGTPSLGYDGDWSGTTSQGKALSFTVSGNALTRLVFGYRASGTCTVDQNVTVTFAPPLPISGASLAVSSPGTPGAPTSTAFTLTGTFSSPTSMTGTLSVSYASSAPEPSCSATASASVSATRP